MSPRTSGFTLLELLVVIAMIGILAALVLASMQDAREEALRSKVLTELRNVHTAMEVLANDTGIYPHKQTRYCPPQTRLNNEVDLSTAGAGLLATDGTYENWDGPYHNSVTHPRGNPYYLDEDYHCSAGALGCDGLDNTSGNPDSSVLVSCGRDGLRGDDPSNAQPNNGIGCAYNDDNIVYVLCRS